MALAKAEVRRSMEVEAPVVVKSSCCGGSLEEHHHQLQRSASQTIQAFTDITASLQDSINAILREVQRLREDISELRVRHEYHDRLMGSPLPEPDIDDSDDDDDSDPGELAKNERTAQLEATWPNTADDDL